MTDPDSAAPERVSDDMLRDMSRLDWSGHIYTEEIVSIITELQERRALDKSQKETGRAS